MLRRSPAWWLAVLAAVVPILHGKVWSALPELFRFADLISSFVRPSAYSRCVYSASQVTQQVSRKGCLFGFQLQLRTAVSAV